MARWIMQEDELPLKGVGNSLSTWRFWLCHSRVSILLCPAIFTESCCISPAQTGEAGLVFRVLLSFLIFSNILHEDNHAGD